MGGGISLWGEGSRGGVERGRGRGSGVCDEFISRVLFREGSYFVVLDNLREDSSGRLDFSIFLEKVEI